MKFIQFLALYMLLFNSCTNNNYSLEKLKDCYPDEKFNHIEQAVKVLDNEIQIKYPADNLKLSYRSFALDWLENNGNIEDVINDAQLIKIHQSLESSGVLKDLSQQALVVNGMFYLCLNKVNDPEVEKYLELRETLGRHLQETLIISGMYDELDGVLALIFKLEYIISKVKEVNS